MYWGYFIMINRRSFFTAIGKAVLGTVIALKMPDNIIPKGSHESEFKDAFAQLIHDYFFTPSPFEKYLLKKYGQTDLDYVLSRKSQ
jgi:hypothetical protein